MTFGIFAAKYNVGEINFCCRKLIGQIAKCQFSKAMVNGD